MNADPRRPGDRDTARPALGAALECPGKLGQFAFPPDERHAAKHTRRVADAILGRWRSAWCIPTTRSTSCPARSGCTSRSRSGHGLPVRARARGAQGARREQAAAADGPPDRVLHQVRRAGAGSVRGRRRNAARRGDRPRRRGARSASRSSRAGSTSTSGGARLRRRTRRRGPAARRPRAVRSRAAARTFDPSRLRAAARRCAARCCRRWPTDRSTSSPPTRPTTPSCKLTMAGGALAETFANRRTDYAMVTDDPADLANSADYDEFLDRMEAVLRRAAARPAAGRLCGRHRPRRVPGRPLPVHRRGPRGAGRARRPRPEGRPDLVPGRHAAAAVRLSEGVRAEHRPPAHPGAARRVAARVSSQSPLGDLRGPLRSRPPTGRRRRQWTATASTRCRRS